MITVTYLSPLLACLSPLLAWRHTYSSTPEHLHPLKPVGGLVEDLLGSGQDRAVGGVPGHPQSGCYPGDGHGLKAQGPQCPLNGRVSQARPGLSQGGGALSPYSAPVRAGEAPQAHQQLCGSPPCRYVDQAPNHRPTSLPLGPAGSAEGVLEAHGHAALHDGPPCGEELAHHGQSQGVQAQESLRSGPVKVVSGTSRSPSWVV